MEHRKKVEDARKVERESRDAVVRKRQEIDSVQSMLDILKNFRQIIDMNEKVRLNFNKTCLSYFSTWKLYLLFLGSRSRNCTAE